MVLSVTDNVREGHFHHTFGCGSSPHDESTVSKLYFSSFSLSLLASTFVKCRKLLQTALQTDILSVHLTLIVFLKEFFCRS